jgi:multisubunit Na+/H+ antiporter MnhC subunit
MCKEVDYTSDFSFYFPVLFLIFIYTLFLIQMLMKKKIYLLTLISLATGMLLTGCGSSSHNGSSGGHKSATKHGGHTWGQFY